MKNQNVSKTHHAVRACLLFFLFTVLGHGAVMAQNPLVATLTHNGTMSTFMGAGALSAAHEAAEPGDVITLSPGTFTGITVTKGVTIRGAGDNTLSSDSLTQTTLTIDVDSTAGELHVEGIYFSSAIYPIKMYGGGFSCCSINGGVNDNYMSAFRNVTIERCKIIGYVKLAKECNVFICNSLTGDPISRDETTSNFTYMNCVIEYSYDTNTHSSMFTNCVFTCVEGEQVLPADNSLSHCIGSSTILQNFTNGSNVVAYDRNTVLSIFKTFNGTWEISADFQLTDEAAATYLGDDGTQVGMYGGANPYSKQLSYPVITRCEVGNRTNEDGTLTVNIEVSQ